MLLIPILLFFMVLYCVSCSRPQELNLRFLTFYAVLLEFNAHIHIGALGPQLSYLTSTVSSFIFVLSARRLFIFRHVH